jgi:mono/diheme cytochrome c family protein
MANYVKREALTRQTGIAGAVLLLLAMPSRGADFAVRARPFFDSHCAACHNSDTKKGGLDLTDLSGKSLDAKSFDQWDGNHDAGR